MAVKLPVTPYTESQIRALAINFLRQHYRHRPRSGTSGTRVVYRPHYYKGVTIDARLAFQQPDLEWFIATVEATPVDRAHEVLYRMNGFKIAALSGLSGVACCAVGLALTQVQGFNVWQWMEGRPAVGLVLLTAAVVAAITALGLMSRRSFRYIYAVEQFKRFYADAQWIAYDPAVFEGRRGAYDELHRQCVLGGFGMMEILPGNKVRDVIEPSHLDQFHGARSRLPLWVAAIQPPPKLRSLVKRLPFPRATAPAPAPTDGLTDPLDVGTYLPTPFRSDDYAARSLRPRPGRPAWYRHPGRSLARLRWKIRHAYRSMHPHEIRRRPGYYDLPWWFVPALVGGLLTIVSVLVLQAGYRPTTRPGARFEAPGLAGLETADGPEESQAEPAAKGGFDLDLNDQRPPDSRPATRDLVVEQPPRRALRYQIDEAGGERVDYECVTLYQLPSTYYLLLAGTYPDLPTARAEADRLHAVYGLPVTAEAEECIHIGGSNYLVYVGDPVTEEGRVNLLIRQYAQRMELGLEVYSVE